MKKKKEKNKKSTIKKVLMIVVPILIVVGIVSAIFIKKYLDEQKPIAKEWGQTYYLYLKDIKENKKYEEANLPKDMKKAKVNFYEVKNVEDPVMAISYDKNNETYTNIYYIKNDSITTMIYSNKMVIEFLYNIEKKEYDYYTHTTRDGSEVYSSLGSQIEDLNVAQEEAEKKWKEENAQDSKDESSSTEENKDEEEDKVEEKEANQEYTFKEGEKSSVTDVNGNEVSIPKFDETFVEVETEDKSVDFDLESDDKELKESITTGVENYVTQDETVTDKVEEKVKEAVQTVEEKHEEMKKAEEEVKKKKEAEEKARKEAEAKELAQGYKIGKYRLKYGKYKNLPMDNINITITLSPNGKCHYTGDDPNSATKKLDTDCTYSQTQQEYYGSMTTFLTMKFNSGGSTIWQMSKDNAFNSQWLGFEYVG